MTPKLRILTDRLITLPTDKHTTACNHFVGWMCGAVDCAEDNKSIEEEVTKGLEDSLRFVGEIVE